jgi:cytochrome oxidase assembly protein ShyY1
MSMARSILRQLASRDGLKGVLAVLLAMAVCIGLGFWQWHRFEGKRENAHVIETNYTADPVGIGDVLPAADTSLPSADRWKQVEMTGEYCTQPECVLYVRNRPLSSSVGFWQLVPFTTDQGTLLVVRGWVDGAEASSTPASEPPVPQGRTTVVVRMRPDEPVLEDRTNPPGQVQTVTPSAIAPDLPDLPSSVYTGAYGELVSEDPPVSPMPQRLETPDTGLGPHLSYAVQWWLFAAFFPVALVVRTRRRILDEAPDAAAGTSAQADRPARDPADAAHSGGTGEAGTATTDGPGGTGRSPMRARSASRAAAPSRGTSAEHRPARRRSQDEEEEDELLDHRGR